MYIKEKELKKMNEIENYINDEIIEAALTQLNIKYKRIGATYYCKGDIN